MAKKEPNIKKVKKQTTNRPVLFFVSLEFVTSDVVELREKAKNVKKDKDKDKKDTEKIKQKQSRAPGNVLPTKQKRRRTRSPPTKGDGSTATDGAVTDGDGARQPEPSAQVLKTAGRSVMAALEVDCSEAPALVNMTNSLDEWAEWLG